MQVITPGRLLVVSLFLVVLLSTVRADQNDASSKGAIQKIDVGGRKLTLLTRGSTGPTVVIEAGFGLAAVESPEWKKVYEAVAKTNRVCVYNRAGLGTSDPAATKPRTSRDIAQDLHQLLSNAKVPGPYILVGHSIGGCHVRVYADMYADEVAGVVLVDATHPDQDAQWAKIIPAEMAGESSVLKSARAFLANRLADTGKNPEGLNWVASREQVRQTRSLGDKPLAVLTHSPKWRMVPGLPDELMNKIEAVSQKLQADLPALSTDSTHKIAEKAGHGIHVEAPDLVIAAISEVVAKVKAKQAKAK